MKNRRELFVEWSFPHVQRFGVTLVARNSWDACVQKIFANGCQFYGYDAFRVFHDGSIQPNGEWDQTWSEDAAPKFDEVLICWRASNFDHPFSLNFDQGRFGADYTTPVDKSIN